MVGFAGKNALVFVFNSLSHVLWENEFFRSAFSKYEMPKGVGESISGPEQRLIKFIVIASR